MDYANYFYQFNFLASVLMTMLYALIFQKHFNINFTLMFVFVVLQNLGFTFLYQSHSLEAVILSQKMIYLGSVFTIVFITLSIFEFCKVRISRLFNFAAILAGMIVYSSVLTIGRSSLFYKSIDIEFQNGILIIHKQYGIMHAVHYAMLVFYLMLSTVVLIHTLMTKKDVSRRTVKFLFFTETFCFFVFFGGRFHNAPVELIPLGYCLSLLIFLIIIRRSVLYDINDAAVESIVQSGMTGFISQDLKFRYLGCNETAKKFFPELSRQHVDEVFSKDSDLKKHFDRALKEFIADNARNTFKVTAGDKIYLFTIGHLFNGSKKCGYEFFITDDTANQKFLAEREKFNALLHQIFPDAIVRRLSENPNATIAERHDEVTVLFSDFAGFTKSTSGKEPELVVQALDTIVRRFDSLCRKYGIEKIKTIGDSYMAACGVPEKVEGHADKMIMFARDMYKSLEEYNRTAVIPFKMRVGLNTGPVVAGKISKNKPIYDLWGDTVNVASRMEGLCREGKILISDDTYRALKDRNAFRFAPPETKPVKGKGEMTVWEVES